MNPFLKKFSNFIVYIVTLLGIFALTEKKIDSLYLATAITLIIFGGFVYLLINHISKIEKKITLIEQKFIRQKELEEIRIGIKLIKNKLRISN